MKQGRLSAILYKNILLRYVKQYWLKQSIAQRVESYF